MALAGSLTKGYATQGGDVTELFAAFVGLVWEMDRGVGLDCLTALDRLVSARIQ